MLISDLIQELAKLRDTHGEVEVRVFDKTQKAPGFEREPLLTARLQTPQIHFKDGTIIEL